MTILGVCQLIRPMSRQTKKQQDQRPNRPTHVNANFRTADYYPELAHIGYCFRKWRLNCCLIAFSTHGIEGVDSVFWYKRIFLQLCCRPKDSSRQLSGRSLNALCSKSNGSYDIKDLGTLSLIFSTSKYFRRKCQPCPSFFSHPNIPDK